MSYLQCREIVTERRQVLQAGFKKAPATHQNLNFSFVIHAKCAWLLTETRGFMPRLCLYCSAQERRAEETGSAGEEFHSVELQSESLFTLCPDLFVKQTYLEKTYDYHRPYLSHQSLACLSPQCRDSLPPV
jgi:hypothetical protein